MSGILSYCFGSDERSDGEHEPLLPRYQQDTHLQRELYRKLHTWQMLRALSKGYMPSNDQVVVNLRTILASNVLNQNNASLSDSGQRLVRLTRLWLNQFITLLEKKNNKDQIQDLIWFLTKSRISLDVNDLQARARKSKVKADVAAAYQSLNTVGSLLLTNSDFRVFLGDLNTVAREVFKDSAFALSSAAETVGHQLEPSQQEQANVANPKQLPTNGKAPSGKDLGEEVQEIGKLVANGGTDVAEATLESAQDKLSGDEGKTLLKRLQSVVLNLRKRKDYSESVSVITLLIKRYALVYSRAAEEIVEVAEEDIQENKAFDRAMANLWEFIISFGKREEWERCQTLFNQVISHKEKDPEFEELMVEIGNSLQSLLTDPDFFNNAEQKLQELREKSKKVGTESSLRTDIDALLQQVSVTFMSVVHDQDIHNLFTTTLKLLGVLSPTNANFNADLVHDAVNVFVPLLVAAIQYVPIPRLEVSTPAIDLLLENLIIEPGVTINHTSFLPYRLNIETYNNLEFRKARFGTATASKHLVLIKLDGMSLRADEIGFWLRAHSGLLRLADQGIASFALDERGIDIHIEVEVCRERMEQILTLRGVRVRVHKLDYKLKKSMFSWIGWMCKPFLRPLIKATMEIQLAAGISDLLHAANRELLYARERLRATRVANPDELLTFLRAIAARLVPAEDPDLDVRVGVDQPGKGVFKGVYTPGSVVKIWHEEAVQAGDRIDEYEVGGWRNEVFTTHVQNMT